MKTKEIKCICKKTGTHWLVGDPNCLIHYPKFEYKFCEYCGKKLVEQLREHEFDKSTGKPLLWVLCPVRKEELENGYEKHSRWIKELVKKC